MVKAAAGAMAWRAVKGERRGRGLAGVGGGGAETAWEDSVVPAGPRGWERRLPIFVYCCLVQFLTRLALWILEDFQVINIPFGIA